MKKAQVYIEINLDVLCPYCNEFFDLLNEKSFDGVMKILKDLDSISIGHLDGMNCECPICGASIEIDNYQF